VRRIIGLWRFWVRHQNLIVVLIALIAAWLLAFASGFWFFFRLAYVLTALVPLSFVWAWANLRALDVTVRRDARRVQVGENASERVTVSNRGWLPKLWLEVEDLPTTGYRVKSLSRSAAGRRSWQWRAVLETWLTVGR
jgi:uncharacterized protein (DUF58 family)